MTRATIPAPPDVLSDEFQHDPWTAYEILRDHYPVTFHEGTNSWLLSRHEDIEWLFKHKQVSIDFYKATVEPAHGRTMVTMDGKEHARHRRLLAPFFSGAGLEAFRPQILRAATLIAAPTLEAEAEAVARGDKERGEFDIVKDFSSHLPVMVIERMLDLPLEDHAQFQRWYLQIMDYVGNVGFDPERTAAGKRARQEMADYFLPMIAERRHGTGTDLMTLMAQAESEGERLEDDEIRAFISLMLAAGGDTTDRGIGSLFVNLFRHPTQLAAVYEDHTLLQQAFAETLRHDAPVHVAGRFTLEDIEIRGVTIPSGASVMTLVASANRDPQKFSEPDRFDMHRTDNDIKRAYTAGSDHLAYGGGRHFCAGATLARNEIIVGVSFLLEHMADLRLADDAELVETGFWTHGYESVPVTFVPTASQR